MSYFRPARIAYNGKKIRPHRVIMEKFLNRPLLPTEHIHHINGDNTDNRIENLILVTASEHSKIHKPQILPMVKICEICGSEFTPHATKRRRQQTCSPLCKNKLIRLKNKAKKLTDDQVNEIRKLIEEKEVQTKIAKKFNVTPAAISYIKLHAKQNLNILTRP